jgi:phenylalanyl-tRNA synthetase alpha chain
MEIEELSKKALEDLGEVSDEKALEVWRIKYLGRKSQLNNILRSLEDLPVEERKAVGSAANKVKAELEHVFEEKRQKLEEERLGRMAGESVDLSLPGYPFLRGGLHPITRVVREISEIFTSMGFSVVEGPEVELDYYNFDALNIPPEHPARDTMQTFWLKYLVKGKPALLRTHTSPMQVRFMESHPPPVRIIVPGKVYRYEATDATHTPMFHQIEGLAVDQGIGMADLKGTLFEFARRFFGPERKVRFRCDYFPFVEPGAEMAVECAICHGEGCRLCSDGWIEVLGAGMVHPSVLNGVGIDANTFSGFAFGMGVERMPMLKYGIDDIRLFYSGDLRFLRQLR